MAYLDNVYAVVQIAPTGIPTYVRLSQNENGRILHFAISGDALPAGSTVVLTGTKPDGAVYSVSGTLANNVATFNEDGQLTAVAGEWDAKVEVTKSGNLIATGRIKFVIDADPSGGNIPSDSQLDGYIAEMLSLLDAGKAEAYGSPLVASTVAGMIDQSRVYVYTGSETGYTAGNWYYWNGSAWTSGGVYNSVAINTDTTLSVAGMAADAKATGDALNGLDTRLGAAEEDITEIKDDLSHIGISEAVKTTLLACFSKVAWIDGQGQTYYNALESALNEDGYPKITALFNQGTNIVYDDATLDSLKQYLTVTYYESSESEGAIVPSTGYTLSGTLSVGLSVITVMYNNMTASFTVTVSERLYIWNGDEAQEIPQRWIDKNAIHGVSPSDYTVVNGYGIRGYIESAGAYPQDSAQRATNRESIIIGDFDGKTIGLTSYTLSSGATVNYGIWYGYINPSTYAFNGTQYVEAGTDNVYVFGKWLGASVTLPTNNSKVGKRVLMMAFKITNATRDFTQAELEEIPSLITIS